MLDIENDMGSDAVCRIGNLDFRRNIPDTHHLILFAKHWQQLSKSFIEIRFA